jgi:C4-dicarboxylate-binding protein DctP
MKTFVQRLAMGLGMAAFAAAGAQAQQFTMKLSSPTVNDITHEWMKAFKAGVEGRSAGRVKVEMYPANQLGQIPATVEGVAFGTIEFTAPATGFLIGLEPRFQTFDAPGLFDDLAQAQRVLADADIRKRLTTFGAAKGVEPLVVYPHGPLMLLSHKPIRTVADFRGQKIRVTGPSPLHIEPFRKLGASPISMPLGEVLPAMQNRAIDGTIAAAGVFTAFKYYDVAKALTYLPGSFLIVGGLVNRQFMSSLGPELEAIVREEAIKAQTGVEKWSAEDVERTMQTWRKNGGEIIKLPANEAKNYIDDVSSVMPSIIASRPQVKEDYDAMRAAAKKYAN